MADFWACDSHDPGTPTPAATRARRFWSRPTRTLRRFRRGGIGGRRRRISLGQPGPVRRRDGSGDGGRLSAAPVRTLSSGEAPSGSCDFSPRRRTADARIHREDQREIVAELIIGFGLFQESFTSQVILDRPRQVLVRAIEGPLEHLTNTWTFTPTHVDLIVDFQFKSHLLDHVANGMFHEAATRMMSAFESHVHLLHMMRRRATQHPSS